MPNNLLDPFTSNIFPISNDIFEEYKKSVSKKYIPVKQELVEINLKAKKAFSLAKWYSQYAVSYQLVGSRAICHPVPENSDEDILCWIDWGNFANAVDELKANGWAQDTGDGYDGCYFWSYRHPSSNVNILITKNGDYYNHFVIAVDVCKALNLLNKADRIKVHNILLADYE